MAEIESMHLERRNAERQELIREKQQTAEAEQLLVEHIRSTEELMAASLLVSGFHNPKHRGWRRNHMIAPNKEIEQTEASTGDEPAPSFSDLVKAARQGDRSAIPALRAMLRENPALGKNNGDLASKTQIHWIDLIAGRDLHYRECLLMQVAALGRQMLAETNGSIVEKMLVDQAISTWLQLNYHENREAVAPAENINIAQFRLKKIESASKRHMKSLAALSTIKVLKPAEAAAIPAAAIESAGSAESGKEEPRKRLTSENRLGSHFERSTSPAPMN